MASGWLLCLALLGGASSVLAVTPPNNTACIRNRIGFHVGCCGVPYLGDYMTALDAAGIPLFIKSVDEYSWIDQAVNLSKHSGVPHSLVFRDAPDTSKDPVDEANNLWNIHMQMLAQSAPNFDKEHVWLEIINEPDKDMGDWLGQFSVAQANLSLAAGIKYLAFGWSTGTPPIGPPYDKEDAWETPGILQYLRMCEKYPDQLGIAIHEYSLSDDDIMSQFPFLVGRVKFLFDVCDRHNITRPKVFITEFGWGTGGIPLGDKGIAQIEEAMNFYALYPEVQGAAIWCFQVNCAANNPQIIPPLQNMTLNTYFPPNCKPS